MKFIRVLETCAQITGPQLNDNSTGGNFLRTKNLLGFLVTMSAFAYLITQLRINNVPLNLATWCMWTFIDSALLYSMIMAGNHRPLIMIGFTTGACTIAALALEQYFNGQSSFVWGHVETLAAVAVGVALYTWRLTTNDGGVIAITTAMYVAMVPTLVDGWHKPTEQDPIFWGLCTLGCILTFFGSEKDIAGRFMPACGTLGNGLMTCFALRQYF